MPAIPNRLHAGRVLDPIPRFSGINSFSGRLGVRIAKSWNPDPYDPRRTFTLWARPSLDYTFTGNPTTSFSSATGYIPFNYDMTGGWA